VSAEAASPPSDRARVVTASWDGAQLWDGKTGAVLATRLVTDNQHVARRRTLSAHGPSPVRLRAVPVIMSDFPVDPCVHAGRGRLIL